MMDRWLDAANAADLEALARSLRDGRLAPPYSATAVQNAGFAEASASLAHFGGTEPGVIAWFLERLARERRESDNRYASAAQLVWSGASEDEQGVRDTRVVLNGLFRQAQHHVLISTYVVYNGKELFRSLAARLAQNPAIQVELYVNIPPSDACIEEREVVRGFLEAFRRDQWPDGARMPAIYYDPESMNPGRERTTLHAKCVVVDHRWALVTSANFTEAAQERNIEAGVLLDHPGIAGALAARFRMLRESGRLRRMGE